MQLKEPPSITYRQGGSMAHFIYKSEPPSGVGLGVRMVKRKRSGSSSSSSNWVSSGSPKRLKKAFAEILSWMSDSGSSYVPASFSRVRRKSPSRHHVSLRSVSSGKSYKTESTIRLARRGPTVSTLKRSRSSESSFPSRVSKMMRYGNYCGPDWSGGRNQPSVESDVPAVDTVDAACKKHDRAYARGGNLAVADVVFSVQQLANIGHADSGYGSAYAAVSSLALAAQAAARVVSGRTHGGGLSLYEKPYIPGIINHEQPVLFTKLLKKKYKRRGLKFTVVK